MPNDYSSPQSNMHCELSLTESQIDLLLELLKPGAQLDPHDGELLLDHAPTALYKKLHDLRHDFSSVLWLTIYECEQAYGGPEEGGWWYPRRRSNWAQGFTEIGCLYDELLNQLRWASEHAVDNTPVPTVRREDLDSWFNPLKGEPQDEMTWSFKTGRYAWTEVTVEWQIGGNDTHERPYYC